METDGGSGTSREHWKGVWMGMEGKKEELSHVAQGGGDRRRIALTIVLTDPQSRKAQLWEGLSM